MNKKLLGLLLTFLLLGQVFAASEVLRIKVEKTSVYNSADGGTEKTSLQKGDVLNIIKKGPSRSMVKTAAGIKGWVNNTDVEFVKGSGRGDVFNIDEQDITGWIDNPSALYILDNSGGGGEALPLSRSFHDEVFERKDREDIERSNDENN